MTIRVFLLDDHALVRSGMRMMLSAETDIEVVGEADTGEIALPMIRKLMPDVVLCDLHLPGISGLEVTERIVKGDYGCKVVVVSVLEDGPIPKRLIEAGASGYVGKAGDAAELLRAVRDVARGKRFLANGVAQHLALAGIGGGASPFDCRRASWKSRCCWRRGCVRKRSRSGSASAPRPSTRTRRVCSKNWRSRTALRWPGCVRNTV